MQSSASTVSEYLKSLPEDRRAAIEAVRKVILANLDKNYEECMSYGMIGYVVPHKIYPAGYHCDPKLPVPFAGLASQKNHMAVYLSCLYGEGEAPERAQKFQAAWKATGKKLDMGASCIRFKKIDDLALDLIGAEIKKMPTKKYLAEYQKVVDALAAARAAKKKK